MARATGDDLWNHEDDMTMDRLSRLWRLALLALSVLSVAAPPGAHAQTYPSKPIKAIVYGAPGSTPDLFARVVAQRMGASMGQQFVIENRPGASGVVATHEVIRAAPDGYTVLFTGSTALVNATQLMKKAPYDPLRDLTPIGATFAPVEVLLVRSDLPVRTVPELVAYARSNPGKLDYGASAVGSGFHLNGELFTSTAGVRMQHVAYKGTVAATQGLAAGDVDVAFNSYGGLSSMLATNRIRVLAILDQERYKALPDVPTVAETFPGYRKIDSWFAVMAPAKLPQPIAARLNFELVMALKSPAVIRWMDDNAVNPIAGPPEQVAELIGSSSVRIKKLVERVGLQPE